MGATRRALPLRNMAIRAIHRASSSTGDQLTAVETAIRNRTKLAIATCMGPIGCGHTSHQCKVLKGHAEKVRAQWAAQPKSGMPAKKKQQVKFKNSTVVDRKYSRAEVNIMINKLKKKFEERTRENEELNEIMQDLDEKEGIEEPVTDAELEEFLNNSD